MRLKAFELTAGGQCDIRSPLVRNCCRPVVWSKSYFSFGAGTAANWVTRSSALGLMNPARIRDYLDCGEVISGKLSCGVAVGSHPAVRPVQGGARPNG
ncbi:hypothetical protein [Saccharopolyspora taberi]|uniref:hypothetical protein n=1 Tax=Saccharopolyspora taberi TaxID=60895 RepID=UPI0031D1C2F5